MAETLAAQGSGQYWAAEEIAPSRGDILAADKFPLVTNQPAFELYAVVPQLSISKEDLAGKISPILESYEQRLSSPSAQLTGAEIEQRTRERLETSLAVWVKLSEKVPEQVRVAIDALGISGLVWQRKQLRIYPEASMGAHVLGIVSGDEAGKDTGYFGLEGKYNGELAGRKGIIRQERDAKGLPILLGGYDVLPAEHGRTLLTTVDRAMQLTVQQRLTEGVEKYGAKGGTVVVMNPKTGGILAMASIPGYDPRYWHQATAESMRNPATADTYEPGSTFKALVMAAVLNEGLVTPSTKCPKCDGPVSVGGFAIQTWNNKYYPQTTMIDVLAHSDNVGMVYVGQRLGLERFWRYYDLFGFTKLSGIDVQDEEPIPVRAKSAWREIDLVTASFGQGIAVNAIQMTRAFAALANEGKLPEPHLVTHIIGEDRTIEIPHNKTVQVIRPAVAKIVTEMLVNAVDQGEAKWAKPKGYRIAGKTGTAQIPIAGHYDPKRTIASFIGYAPADDPKYVMLVRLNEPSTSPWGSETAAPLFFDIAKDFFSYFGIPPEQ